MTFKYKEVVPWGRSYNEYIRMFDITNNELKLKFLGCGDGPASFNYELNRIGGDVISIDPIYSLSKDEIQKRIDETSDDIMSQMETNQEKFRWNVIESVEELGKIRMEAMNLFLNSFEESIATKRYIPGKLPKLPFADDEFDISLSSHFLFLYSNNLTFEFHLQSIKEMLRVSKEARIFPLLDVNGNKSPYLKKIESEFELYKTEIRKVSYEFQIGGNEMLTISKA